MNIKLKKLTDLINLTNQCLKEVFDTSCFAGSLKDLQFALKDFKKRSDTTKIEDLEGFDEALSYLISSAERFRACVDVFDECRDVVWEMREQPDSVSLEEVEELYSKVDNINEKYTEFNKIAYDLENEIFATLSKSDIGSTPYLDAERMLKKIHDSK